MEVFAPTHNVILCETWLSGVDSLNLYGQSIHCHFKGHLGKLENLVLDKQKRVVYL